jgi:hypothetical protein
VAVATRRQKKLPERTQNVRDDEDLHTQKLKKRELQRQAEHRAALSFSHREKSNVLDRDERALLREQALCEEHEDEDREEEEETRVLREQRRQDDEEDIDERVAR